MTSSLFPHVQFVATWMSLRAKYVQPSCLVISAQGCRSFAVDASYLCCFCFFVWSLISHKDEKLQNKNQQLIVEVNKSAFLAVGSIIFYILIFFFFYLAERRVPGEDVWKMLPASSYRRQQQFPGQLLFLHLGNQGIQGARPPLPGNAGLRLFKWSTLLKRHIHKHTNVNCACILYGPWGALFNLVWSLLHVSVTSFDLLVSFEIKLLK